jgi:hypothetical protein
MSLYLSKRRELAVFIGNDYYRKQHDRSTFYICYHLDNNGRIVEYPYHVGWLNNDEFVY